MTVLPPLKAGAQPGLPTGGRLFPKYMREALSWPTKYFTLLL